MIEKTNLRQGNNDERKEYESWAKMELSVKRRQRTTSHMLLEFLIEAL